MTAAGTSGVMSAVLAESTTPRPSRPPRRSSASCLVGEDSVAMASGLGRCLPKLRRSAVALRGKITAIQTDRVVIEIDGE
jgi:hypothetical protein